MRASQASERRSSRASNTFRCRCCLRGIGMDSSIARRARSCRNARASPSLCSIPEPMHSASTVVPGLIVSLTSHISARAGITETNSKTLRAADESRVPRDKTASLTVPGTPVTVSDAVLSRGTRLSSAARNVLEFVSVIPARAEMWLVNETINPGTTVLAECIGSGMLQSDGDALAFRHDLARRAIEESIPIPRRQHLHRKVLDALLDRRSEAWLARIVHHAAQAGDPASVLRHAPLAARQAATFNAHRDSAAHYQTALQYADLIAPGERARLWESRSYECFLSGQNDEAFKARQKALEIWQQAEENICQAD